MGALLCCELGLAVTRTVITVLGICGVCPKDVLIYREERDK